MYFNIESVRRKDMFYVSTTWKHENEINNEKMQNLLASFKGTNPNVKEVHWWKIDNFTHDLISSC